MWDWQNQTCCDDSSHTYNCIVSTLISWCNEKLLCDAIDYWHSTNCIYYTVHPKNIQTVRALLRIGTDQLKTLPLSFRASSLVLGESYDWLNTSEAILRERDKVNVPHVCIKVHIIIPCKKCMHFTCDIHIFLCIIFDYSMAQLSPLLFCFFVREMSFLRNISGTCHIWEWYIRGVLR